MDTNGMWMMMKGKQKAAKEQNYSKKYENMTSKRKKYIILTGAIAESIFWPSK